MIIYPPKPWTNGETFSFIQPDGTYILGTYNLPKNSWTLQRVLPESLSNRRPPIFSDTPPTVYPDTELPDDSLIPGDIWYDTSNPNGAVKYVWDGNEWILDASVVDSPNIDLSSYASTVYVDQKFSLSATQEDVAIAATTVDAKFDMLRAAIQQSTNFATLKARLLAVLQ